MWVFWAVLQKFPVVQLIYCVFGRVREMSGSAVVGVIVEALSEQCDQHQSEATTTQDGSYRIRALKPDCQYRVSVKSGADGAAAPHCFPSQFEVRMTAEDLKGLDMVAAPYDLSTDLAVEVERTYFVAMNKLATVFNVLDGIWNDEHTSIVPCVRSTR
ncbi:hypothetical protein ANCDUO_20860, partial [Ancylostoma duodenale]